MTGRWCLALMTALLASGCVSLRHSTAPVSTYEINLERTRIATDYYTGWSIRVRSFTVQSRYADPFLIYRMTDQEYESDFYKRWLTDPADMLTGEIAEWLSRSPILDHVATEMDRLPVTHVLEGHVTDLYTDLRDRKSPAAVLALRLSLSEDSNGKRMLILQRTYESKTPLASTEPALIVEAYAAGLKSILADFETDLKNLQAS